MNIMLIEVHGLEPQYSTLIYMFSRIGFIAATPVPGLVMKYKICTRLQMLYAAYAIAVVTFAMRPGDIIGEPKLAMPIISVTVSGFSMALMLTNTLPEMIDSIEQQTNLVKDIDRNKLEAFVSKYLVIIAAIGQCLGMFMAAIFTATFGYDFTYLFASAQSLVVGVIYVFMCGSQNFTAREI